METPIHLPPPPSGASMSYHPPQQESPPLSDGVGRFKKTKAIKAIRSILGLFHKPGRRKSEDHKLEEQSMKQDSPVVQRDAIVINPVSSCQSSSHGSDEDEDMASAAESNGKEYSDSALLDGLQNMDTGHSAVNSDLVDDDLSRIGNVGDDEFQDNVILKDGLIPTTDDSDDVFLNESYFEDDYFEDFSGSSSPANIECPMFTPPKKIKFRAKSCDCYRDSDILLANDIFKTTPIRRHSSMPCLSDLASETKERADSDEPKNIDHLLQAPTPYFTLGMEMITDHFGKGNGPEVDQGKAEVKVVLSDVSSPKVKMSPLRINENVEEKPGCSETPAKQKLSFLQDNEDTPLTPFKKKGESAYKSISRSKSGTPKRCLKARKNLYKENNLSPKVKCSDSNQDRRIADGLSAVAEWVMQVVAFNGSNIRQISPVATQTKDINVSEGKDKDFNSRFKQSPQKCARTSKEKSSIPFSKPLEIFDLPQLSNELNTDINGIATKFDDIDHRPRLESGYASKSRCSTPATPFSEPATPMSKLHSGKVMSPYSLNKLDGLTPRLNPVKRKKESPKFLFPPHQSSFPLKAVEEVTESRCDSSGIVEKSFKSINDANVSDVILSAGGDVDSLATSSNNSPCSSSGSVFWSVSSTASRGPNHILINIIDENNNVVEESPFARLPVEELPEISSPAIKKLQPISTSSPLQAINTNVLVKSPLSMQGKDSFRNKQKRECGVKMTSSIQLQAERKDTTSTKGIQLLGHECKVTLQVPPAKRRKGSSSRSSRTARTCLKFEDNDDSRTEVRVRRPSEDYLLLKRVAKFIVGLGNSKINLKANMDTPALMGNLKENYHRIMVDNEIFKGLQLISQLKQKVEKMQKMDALTIGNSVDQYLLNLLIECKEGTLTSADFIFQNLQSIVRKNASFFSLPPELFAILLSNDHCIVKGPNGFPLHYKASEKEVLKVAVKVVESCNRKTPQDSNRVQRLLYQVVDPKVVLKDVFSELEKTGKDKTLRVPTTSPPRTRHRISYRQSDCPSEDILSSTQLMSCAVTSQNERTTLYELKKNGTINVEAPVDVRMVCNEEHCLRTLYFCYGSFEGVPYIADVGLQYVSKGKKKTLFLGSPPTPSRRSRDRRTSKRPRASSSSSEEAKAERHGNEAVVITISEIDSGESGVRSPAYPVSERPNPFPLKKAAMVLAAGEHITAISVLGNSDGEIHNLEIITNSKRRVRAHAIPALPDAKWIRIRPPSTEDTPICLHALIGETRTTPTEGTRLCRLGALWAMTSWASTH